MGPGRWLAPRSYEAGGNTKVFVGEAKATVEQRLVHGSSPAPAPTCAHSSGGAAGDKHKPFSAL